MFRLNGRRNRTSLRLVARASARFGLVWCRELILMFQLLSLASFRFSAMQERNEQEGKVAAIKSLQQWRLTDVELHNFINRCVINLHAHFSIPGVVVPVP